jgi:phosphatidylglycerophosphatase C
VPSPTDASTDAAPDRDSVIVAAFDFDKTLSTRDNGVPFFTHLAGRRAVQRAALRCLPDLARGRRDAVKVRITREIFAGREADEVHAAAEEFAADILARHLRDDVVERARRHADEGHRLVVVSASYECYVAPVAGALGFDAALATVLEVDDAGVLTGELAGPNVRRAEKVVRLDRWLTAEGLDAARVRLWAYGDSAGDAELLARADHPVRVKRRPIGE